jgi:hypothetical protein
LSEAALPTIRQREFEDYLALQNLSVDQLTAKDKIDWLGTLVRNSSHIAWYTFHKYGQALSAFGPTDESERENQNRLVRAFTLELRHHRVFKPTRLPAPAMPLSVFRHLMWSLRARSAKRSRIIPKARMRCILQLAWRVGLRPQEALRARRSWLCKTETGYILQCQGKYKRRRRRLVIPTSGDILTCAANELDNWLGFVPDDPDTFLFPASDLLGQIRPNASYDKPRFFHALQRYLADINASQYGYSSIQRSFLRRGLVQLGEPATFFLSGYSSPELLRRNLRAEPDWSSLPDAFED